MRNGGKAFVEVKEKGSLLGSCAFRLKQRAKKKGQGVPSRVGWFMEAVLFALWGSGACKECFFAFVDLYICK